MLVPRHAIILVKSVDDPFGRRAIQHISCIRVGARAALVLVRSPSARACECTFLRRGHLVSTLDVVRVYGCIGASAGIHVVACKGWMLVLHLSNTARCACRLIPTDPGLIPHKKTTNPTNPTNPDLEIDIHEYKYFKIRISRISGISRRFVWDSSKLSRD